VRWQSRTLEVREHSLENMFFELSLGGLGGVSKAERKNPFKKNQAACEKA